MHHLQESMHLFQKPPAYGETDTYASQQAGNELLPNLSLPPLHDSDLFLRQAIKVVDPIVQLCLEFRLVWTYT